MTWNYRNVQYAGGSGFGLHDVGYNLMGEPVRMTENPAGFVSETRDGVLGALDLALKEARHRPIFVPPPDWSKTSLTPRAAPVD